MNPQIIFIGGIHGSGKGTICKKICSEIEIVHLSASELLRWKEISNEKNKKVVNIPSTQERLINGLNAVVEEGKKYLLDGHFCLLNAMNKPEKISEETFIVINPMIISVVFDNINSIIKRLKERDGRDYDFNMLQGFQNMEMDYAEEIASKLKVPFLKITNGDTKNLINHIQKLN